MPGECISSYSLVYTDVPLEWFNILTYKIYQWDAIFINPLYQWVKHLACHYMARYGFQKDWIYEWRCFENLSRTSVPKSIGTPPTPCHYTKIFPNTSNFTHTALDISNILFYSKSFQMTIIYECRKKVLIRLILNTWVSPSLQGGGDMSFLSKNLYEFTCLHKTYKREKFNINW
jgi:hypothetical protein